MRGEQNTYPVRLRINHNNTSAYIPTGVKVEPQYFDAMDMRTPISSKAMSAQVKNEQIALIIRKYDEVVFDLRRDDGINFESLTANEIREYIIKKERKCKREKARAHGRVDFMDWLDKFGQSKSTPKTRKMYAYAWQLLHEYCKVHGKDRIYFDELEYRLFVELRNWVYGTGRGESVRNQLEASMHAAWREARRMKMVSGEDPWLDYKIEKPAPPEEIEFATIEDIRKVVTYDLRGDSGEEWLTRVRDLLMLSWCLCGANLKDIYHMPKPKGDELVFVRQKMITRSKRPRPVHIRIEPELQAMLCKYNGKDRAFCFADEYPNWDTFTRKVSERLDRLCKLAGAEVNFQLLRRSWATYALRTKHTELTVDSSMGHSPNMILTQRYGAHDWEETAKCNRDMIDLLIGG